jgi:hypothetical protein
MTRIHAIFFSALLLTACQKDTLSEQPAALATTETESSFENIHAAMRPYVEAFEEEANLRGLSFTQAINLLDTHFEDISQTGVAGQCSWSSQHPNTVTIDTPFWNNASDLSREFVVFHELGHCILNRGHNESQNANGFCLSIMASGTGSCFSA